MEAIVLPADELRSWAWCTVDEAATLTIPLLANRVAAAARAKAAGSTVYLENGLAPA